MIEKDIDTPIASNFALKNIMTLMLVSNNAITASPSCSILQSVNAVAMGKSRSKMRSHLSGDYREDESRKNKVLNLQIHGDAAFAGQVGKV